MSLIHSSVCAVRGGTAKNGAAPIDDADTTLCQAEGALGMLRPFLNHTGIAKQIQTHFHGWVSGGL
ncbi:hypothetical protein EYF80_010547 [Liparis tanakae]|uniref:Uncharacterized protein n=1 Tax=Liparis tanakae TaxID=230148 RepID=A0A4Z2IQ13_9TELE|nr:hypothetical protein EYF80_010547 [Liparis tanakae]